MKSLDAIDMKILNRLRQNGRISVKDLSAEVFLTMPAVAARMEKSIWKRWDMASRLLS